ncbi:MAG: trypsin-like peptidase domain-containing protein [Marinilabiliaceae bacterium]|nr:trypsin-like peptidase domain-containing protein [Marinilabiliaceae bacterium]
MKLFFCIAFLFSFYSICFISGQIRFRGLPKSIINRVCDEVPYVVMPDFTICSAITDDEKLKNNEACFAHSFDVNITPDNSGIWNELADGSKMWRVGICSKNAYSINIIFDRFEIPDGAQLFVYNKKRGQLKGAFSNKSFSGFGSFAVEPVSGDSIIVEYIEPPFPAFKGKLRIDYVNHDYKGVFGLNDFNLNGLGASENCHPDLSCESNVYPEEKSVLKLIVDGKYLCTGTMINNTEYDGTPYVITANHCLDYFKNEHTFLCYFNYQVPFCRGFIDGISSQTMTGNIIRAQFDSLDFVLFELNQIPPLCYQPYWVGWSLTSTPEPPFHIIHHPQGDVKKFGRTVNNIFLSTFNSPPFLNNSHWKVSRWKTGSTEGGSSGCALFDYDGYLLGTLSGGDASCDNPVNDYFVRFNKAWDYKSINRGQLKFWLDPDDKNVELIDGFSYYKTKLERISNVEFTDSTVFSDPTDLTFGNWLGNNSWGTQGFAETYNEIDSATIYGVYVMIGECPQYSDNKCRFRLWSGEEFFNNQIPVWDTVITMSYLNSLSENFIELEEPVRVEYPISLTCEFQIANTSDNIGIFWQYSTSRKANSLYIKDDNLWYPFYNIHPKGLNSSAFVDLLASDVHYSEKYEESIPENRIDVYYNSIGSSVMFEWYLDRLNKLEIFSITGSKIDESIFGYANGKDSYITNNMVKGVYLFKFSFDTFTHIEKIIVR